MKKLLVLFGIIVISGAAVALAMGDGTGNKEYTWRYKMTVEIETPEGIKIGSAVRQMGNSSPLIDLPDVGNPAGVKGEAVVVDLGERGVLFALISHHSDNEFYNAFPVPGNRIGNGGSSPEGIKYYASLPVGTKSVLQPEYFPSYPNLVTFTDMADAKSVTLAQVWERNDSGYYELREDRMEELFGEGVKLKEITLEITDEPVTKTRILEVLPKFDEVFWKWRRTLKFNDLRKISGANFSKGSVIDYRKGMKK